MSLDREPEPEPRGALVPPPRTPPVAIVAPDAMPPLGPRREIVPSPDALRDLIRSALDALDDVGDSIAGAVGLR